MRLTLRTLLAYLDDILETHDAEELSTKIRESDFAGGLIHRIRNSVGRMRLSSPQVLGKGLGTDANTVAEYLDNTLPSERVPDFEKICLESDMMLSEVASCHEILTIVLGENASVEPSLRRRIYGLADGTHPQAPVDKGHAGEEQVHRRIDAAVASRDLLTDSETEPVSTAASASASRRVVAPFLLVAGLAAIVAVAMWLLPERPLPVTQSGSLAPSANSNVVATAPAMLAEDNAHDLPEMSVETPAPPENIPAPHATGESIYTNPVEAPIPTPVTNDDMESTTAADANQARDVASEMTDAADPGEIAVPDPTEIAAASQLPAEQVPPPPNSDSPRVPTRLLARKAVIAQWQPDHNTWWQLTSTNACPVDTRLRVLPASSPRLMLDDTLDLSLLGPAEWIVAGNDQRWTIYRGRFTMANLQEQTTPFKLAVGQRAFDFRCTSPSTIAMLEVRNLTPLGADPGSAERLPTVNLWVVNGTVELTPAEEPSVEVTAGNRWWFVSAAAAEIIPDIPPSQAAWSIRDIDLQARASLIPLLSQDESLADALESAFRDRRTDVRSLAARGLAALDVFEPLVSTLNDPRFHASWPAHFDDLRVAVQRSPESAAKIRTAIAVEAGPNADMLYRMLWGFSARQLEDGAAGKLIDALSHRDMAVRVIAGETLREITQASAGYRADYHPKRRRDAIRIWQRRLNDGTLRYSETPVNDSQM